MTTRATLFPPVGGGWGEPSAEDPDRSDDANPLAKRVMRARRNTICPVCKTPIYRGQQIALLGTWQHIDHVVKRLGRSA